MEPSVAMLQSIYEVKPNGCHLFYTGGSHKHEKMPAFVLCLFLTHLYFGTCNNVLLIHVFLACSASV